ncbi:formate dehydrogenase subunit gamma [Caenispirillum bisanense]|uniref:formate dehydrogenase subunit gamma n=1 Tax=Caenispirillum bisanense TaxID=414052 RepID=UPI0031D64728
MRNPAASLLAAAVAVVALLGLWLSGPAAAQDVRPPAGAAASGEAARPLDPALPQAMQYPPVADQWQAINDGTRGFVNIPDKKAGRLIQTQGMEWLAWRNDELRRYGAYAIAGMLIALSGFFAVKGRIKVEGGLSGRLIQRFKPHEIIGHWLTAGSFLVLALTGLWLLFGRPLLLPVLGPDAFAVTAEIGKYMHNFGGFVFMAGLAYIFVMWVRHNLWDRYDLNWILKGGGLFAAHSHPPADKFNFGQKTVFWMVILLGGALSVTGLTLLMPFWFVDEIELMQFAQIIHAGLGIGMFALMLAHIYIGSVGMEHAANAMRSGWVDVNWARDHHSVWVDKYEAEGGEERQGPATPPAAGTAPPAHPQAAE